MPDDLTPEEYTRFYMEQALFRLMQEREFDKISVTDITAKAGVGRVTFYRHFKRKEDVVLSYFERHTKNFLAGRRYYPRSREDYIAVASDVFAMFREHRETFLLLKRARLESLYLDYLNRHFCQMFRSDHPERNSYTPYLYAGMLFNISMAWLDRNCAESPEQLAAIVLDTIYKE